MSDNTIPEYLQPALAQLEKARAAHLENARLMDETVTAIERAEQEKNALFVLLKMTAYQKYF